MYLYNNGDVVEGFPIDTDGFFNISDIDGNGKINIILEVNWGGINRITSNGNQQKIDIEIFKKIINHILENGSITRQEINDEYSKRASSGIVLILSQLPMIHLNNTRPISIELIKG